MLRFRYIQDRARIMLLRGGRYAIKYLDTRIYLARSSRMPNKNALTRSKMNQAKLLLEQRRMDEAKLLLEKVCNIDRRNIEAWRLLGLANAIMGSHKEAERCFRVIVERHPEIADDHYNLGTSLLNQDRHEEAAVCFRQATHIRPDYSEAYCNLGSVLDSLHRMDEAVSCYREAIRHEPGRMELRYNLGQALKSQGKLEEAVDCFRVALQVQPGNFDIHFSLATTLVDQAKLDEAIDCYKLMVERGLGRPTVASNLLLALNYHPATNARSIFAAHKHWEELYGRSATIYSSWPNTPTPDRPVRVGYVSPDYWDHSVSYFIEPILQHHNPQSVETFCYADNKRDDHVSERLKNLPLAWRKSSGLSDADLCQMIRNDRIDILVDLAGHTGSNRLSVFSRKPAPIQVSYLGYPNTTGLRSVDYRLTDAWSDPLDQDVFYTEKLIRLPKGFLCFRPPDETSAVSILPAERSGYATFGSFNNMAKINTLVIQHWSKILRALPTSRLILKNKSLRDSATQRRCQNMFAQHGISQDRIKLIGWLDSKADHLGLYNEIDIALDTFPYNGTTTTCEALWMGVPVVTLAGDRHAGRVGVSLLTQVELNELIATDPDQYVQIAASLAGNLDRLSTLRAGLRGQMAKSPLCNAQVFTQDLERVYREVWKEWCAKQNQQI
jgi:predicted O-linked N-acetylglucosamine transferase (SPINDLY family)